MALNDADGSQLHISAKTGEVGARHHHHQPHADLAGQLAAFFRPLDDIGLGEQRKDILT